MGSFDYCISLIVLPERADFVTSDWSEVIVAETSERNSQLKTQCVRELGSGSVGGSDLYNLLLVVLNLVKR
nr:hypothetical protein [Tanacetum cinerariifolium]